MEVRGEGYIVSYDSGSATISCSGMLDLRGKEGYGEILQLFEKVVEENPEGVVLDLRELEFLNSSGITTIGGFIIKLRNKGGSKLQILCANKFTWQFRSMQGLQKLMPGMSLEFT